MPTMKALHPLTSVIRGSRINVRMPTKRGESRPLVGRYIGRSLPAQRRKAESSRPGQSRKLATILARNRRRCQLGVGSRWSGSAPVYAALSRPPRLRSSSSGGAAMSESSDVAERAARLHAESIVIDACATILRDHQYASYWIEGGATCALATVALAEDTLLSTMDTIGAFLCRARQHPGTRLAVSADEIVQAKADG